FGQSLAFTNHSFKIGRYHFRTYIPIYQIANRFVMIIYILLAADAFFSHQTWIGGYPIQYAQILCFLDLLQIRRVDKKFHMYKPVLLCVDFEKALFFNCLISLAKLRIKFGTSGPA